MHMEMNEYWMHRNTGGVDPGKHGNVLWLKPSETHEWLLKKHYAHRIPNIIKAFGYYQKGELLGVCTFGMPPSHNLCVGVCGEEHKDRVWELNRLCIDKKAYEYKKNVASYFVGCCLRRVHNNRCPKGWIIVSYADTAMGHVGTIYQATNWLYTGATPERTDIFSEGHSRHHEGDKSKRMPRSSKHRYVYLIGNRRAKTGLKRALNYPILPYPEGESKRYDADYKPTTQLIMEI